MNAHEPDASEGTVLGARWGARASAAWNSLWGVTADAAAGTTAGTTAGATMNVSTEGTATNVSTECAPLQTRVVNPLIAYDAEHCKWRKIFIHTWDVPAGKPRMHRFCPHDRTFRDCPACCFIELKIGSRHWCQACFTKPITVRRRALRVRLCATCENALMDRTGANVCMRDMMSELLNKADEV
jgi:hypothetical protein